jgi:hypothetical protein
MCLCQALGFVKNLVDFDSRTLEYIFVSWSSLHTAAKGSNSTADLNNATDFIRMCGREGIHTVYMHVWVCVCTCVCVYVCVCVCVVNACTTVAVYHSKIHTLHLTIGCLWFFPLRSRSLGFVVTTLVQRMCTIASKEKEPLATVFLLNNLDFVLTTLRGTPLFSCVSCIIVHLSVRHCIPQNRPLSLQR